MPALEEETQNASIFYKGPENRHFNIYLKRKS